MAAKAINYKNWCVDNISPQCWPRILLKSMDILRDHGYHLNDMENPPEDLVLDARLVVAFNHALKEIYDIEIEEGVLE